MTNFRFIWSRTIPLGRSGVNKTSLYDQYFAPQPVSNVDDADSNLRKYVLVPNRPSSKTASSVTMETIIANHAVDRVCHLHEWVPERFRRPYLERINLTSLTNCIPLRPHHERIKLTSVTNCIPIRASPYERVFMEWKVGRGRRIYISPKPPSESSFLFPQQSPPSSKRPSGRRLPPLLEVFSPCPLMHPTFSNIYAQDMTEACPPGHKI